jgi:HPt (histidine-containing phosphotransfer) domain-containing protein
VLTANARPEDIQMAQQAGCDAHLSKPISKASLLAALDKYARPSTNGTHDDKRIKIQVPSGIEELVPTYLAARKHELAGLNDALQSSNFEHIRALAHNLKGTGSSYGFEELTKLGGVIEASASQQDAPAVRKALAELQEYLNHVELVGR